MPLIDPNTDDPDLLDRLVSCLVAENTDLRAENVVLSDIIQRAMIEYETWLAVTDCDRTTLRIIGNILREAVPR